MADREDMSLSRPDVTVAGFLCKVGVKCGAPWLVQIEVVAGFESGLLKATNREVHGSEDRVRAGS